MTACKFLTRCGQDNYQLTDDIGRTVEVTLKDHHVLHLARMLGFEAYYSDLEGQLELSTAAFVGTLLVAETRPDTPPLGVDTQSR